MNIFMFISLILLVAICVLFVYVLQLKQKITEQNTSKRQMDQLNDRIATLTKSNERFKSQVKQLNKEIQEARQECQSFTKEREDFTESYEKLERSVQQEREWLKREQKQAQKQIQSTQSLKDELKLSQEQLAEAHKETLSAKRMCEGLQKENADSRLEKTSLAAHKRQLTEDVQRLTKDNLELKKSIARLKKEFNSKKWVTQAEHIRVQKLLKNAQLQLKKNKPKSSSQRRTVRVIKNKRYRFYGRPVPRHRSLMVVNTVDLGQVKQ